ncbi:MAG: hypothetical protein ACREIT_09130 [Tepidisphaeraceae bacterium]
MHVDALLAAALQEGDDDDNGDAPGQPPNPPVDPEVGANPASAPSRQASVVGGGGAAQPRAEGNAIYRIDRDGFVSEIFRQPVLVLSLVMEKGGTLLAGTGSEGLIFQLNPAAEETAVIAKVEPRQVMSLLPAHDGNIYLGLANVGGLATMSSTFAASGTYTSPVLDAQQISRFGNLQLHGSLPEGTSITVATRSGNVAEAGETGWSKWTDDVAAARFVAVKSPAARYLQYRVTFNGTPEGSPVIEDVNVAYQLPNLAPAVRSIRAVQQAAAQPQQGEGAAQPAGKVQISWDAADPNGDKMRYTLHYRAGPRRPWIVLKEDVKGLTFDWDTRAVADGRYELRVTATDSGANSPGGGKSAARVSDPVFVDNTPPVVGDIQSEVKGDTVKVSARAVDVTGTVASLHYSVDASDDWQAVMPSDNIFDSNEESSSFTVTGLKPGPHQITLRAADARGNLAHETVLLTVEPPQAAGR